MSDFDYIRKLLPEIGQIKDEEIRRKVSQVWINTWQKSKWKLIEDCVYNPLVPGMSLIDHTRAVTIASIKVAEVVTEIHSIKLNCDYLVAACLLHDVSKLLEYEMKNGKAAKSELGKKLAHGFLGAAYAMEAGLPLEITHLISTHASQSLLEAKPPVAKEGMILFNTDSLLTEISRDEAGAQQVYQRSLSRVVSSV